jgi:Family of unknown function (DUF6338)
MLVTSFQALAVALLAIVPGYITIFFWSRNKMWRGLTNDLQTVLKAVAISAVLQVVLAPYVLALLYPMRGDLAGHPWFLFVWAVLVVLLLPYIAGTLTGKASDWLELKSHLKDEEQGWWVRLLLWLFPQAAPPSVWDSMFSRDPPDGSFVILEFRDGSRVAGTYAGESEVFQSPEPHGLYLSEEWTLDENGNIDEEVPNSRGVMITDLSDLRCVRFLRGGENERNEASPEATEQAAKTRSDQGSHAIRAEGAETASNTDGAKSTPTKEADSEEVTARY